MRPSASRSLCVIACITVLLFWPALPAAATPVAFQWGTFYSSTDATPRGVYNQDDSTILQTGDQVQLIWAGPDGLIDPPATDGTPGGDDRLLDTSAVQNGFPLPPLLQNKGYVPLKDYAFDSGAQWSGGVVYLRAWNAGAAGAGTAYGNSVTATLTGDGSFNAPRWHTDTAWNATASVTWGSFNLNGDTTEGVYDADNSTILQTGDLVQFIWAGGNGQADPPAPNGAPGGDDQLLDVGAVENNPGPSEEQNKGYVLAKPYAFHLGDAWNGGVIYIRAWNAGASLTADHYGDSTSGTLTDGASFNAPRWHTAMPWSQPTMKTYLPVLVR